jgi:hypothetical protein
MTPLIKPTRSTIRPGKFVHDALRDGIRLRSKTWGKKSRDPRKARREGKREISLHQ